MDKGWGLTMDSDSLGRSTTFFPLKPTVLDSFLNNNNVNYNNNNNNTSNIKRNRDPDGGGDMFSAIEFPVSRARREEHTTGHMQQLDHENRRAVVGEVDFFHSDKNRLLSHDHHNNDAKTNTTSTTSSILHVKKENSHDDLDVNTGLRLLTANTGSEQSTVEDGVSSLAVEKRAKIELAKLQMELERMNTENQKLRGMVQQVSSNYNALQVHIGTLMTQQQQQQQQQNRAAVESTQDHHEIIERRSEDKEHEIMVPRQFLDLGPTANAAETDDQLSHSTSEERTRSLSPQNNKSGMAVLYDSDKTGSGLGIGREESPGSETQGWVPNKVPRLESAKPVENNQSAVEATMRKARVSVRARSEAPMITDGCQWRKYGQKMAKGNPCPRAYYRCTMNVGCPVRKQVQRCAEDRSILITTYEGNHNHPLPPAAMAMASTTSAAASMLLSGSMSSADGLMNSNFLARAILPCSSNVATISASAPFPTVTLDLTHSPNPLQFQRPPPAQFQVPFQGQPQNFASQPASSMPQIFGQALYNQSKFSGLQLSQDMDTVSAATAAITADPNFTAALAAAITSIINNGAHSNNNMSSNNNNGTTTTTTSNSNGNISSQQQ